MSSALGDLSAGDVPQNEAGELRAKEPTCRDVHSQRGVWVLLGRRPARGRRCAPSLIVISCGTYLSVGCV